MKKRFNTLVRESGGGPGNKSSEVKNFRGAGNKFSEV